MLCGCPRLQGATARSAVVLRQWDNCSAGQVELLLSQPALCHVCSPHWHAALWGAERWPQAFQGQLCTGHSYGGTESWLTGPGLAGFWFLLSLLCFLGLGEFHRLLLPASGASVFSFFSLPASSLLSIFGTTSALVPSSFPLAQSVFLLIQGPFPDTSPSLKCSLCSFRITQVRDSRRERRTVSVVQEQRGLGRGRSFWTLVTDR